MTDITPEHESLMRSACHTMIAIEHAGPFEKTHAGRSMARNYVDKVQPELVLMLLDMGNQMTDAVERIEKLVKAAGFDNLEQALKAIERIGKALHGVECE